jgi:hypothetical protein
VWLQPHLPDLAALLKPHAAGLVTDGRMIGAASARVMTDGGPADTGSWKPGDTLAATKVLGTLGVGDGTPGDAQAAAEEIAHGTTVSLARVLVEGAQAGSGARDVARNLLAALADKAKAAAGALDELVKAIGRAAAGWYRQQQVEYAEWAVDDSPNVCPACLANEAAAPVPYGSPFPSGDAFPPAHPRCRCAVIPSRRPQPGNGD